MDLKELDSTVQHQIHPWELARSKVVFDLLQPYLKPMKRYTFLDIGCGDLFFIDSLRNKLSPNEHRYIAYDPLLLPKHINEFSEKDVPNPTPIQIFNKEELITGKVDFVFLMDVLEHIKDDRDFMQQLLQKAYCTQDTIFVITVPAYSFLFCAHDRFLLHYRRYRNKDIALLCKQTNLHILYMGYFFFSLLFPRLLQVGKEKIGNQKVEKSHTDLSTWRHSGFLTKLVTNFLYADYCFALWIRKIGIRLPGLSNFVLCKKP